MKTTTIMGITKNTYCVRKVLLCKAPAKNLECTLLNKTFAGWFMNLHFCHKASNIYSIYAASAL